MSTEIKSNEKNRLHPRNRNRERYDLDTLIQLQPELTAHLKPNKYGEKSLDFSDPNAVKMLNTAILQHYYGIENWGFPNENLCPPIPGRADYILYAADLLASSNFGEIPTGLKINCLDIGVGANCIYPILGVVEYGWNFRGSDIDQTSIDNAKAIIEANPVLKDKIEFVLQEHPSSIFHEVLQKEDRFDLTVCNPPFHSSTQEAEKGSRRKVKNLSGKRAVNPILNFAGISKDLICEGGEIQFIKNMVGESKRYAKNCFWYTTLVSKQSNVKTIVQLLNEFNASEVKTIPMGTGNKSTRLVAWTFLSKEEQKLWVSERWKKEK